MFRHESGIHVDGLLKDPRSYQTFDPAEPCRRHELVLGKHSGSVGVTLAYQRIGVQLSADEAAQLLQRVRRFVIERLKNLSGADDFLRSFGVDHDEHVVHVSRLHILKRFHPYLGRETGLEGWDDVALFRHYRALLQKAYSDFVTSTAQQEKVFEVFQMADGQQHVSLKQLRASLAAAEGDAAAAGLCTAAAPD